MSDSELGLAALAAADEILEYQGDNQDTRGALLLMGGDCSIKVERMAGFVRAAGDVPGESLYRWSARSELHPLPADGWEKTARGVRLFFDAFTAVAKALAPILDPPQRDKIVAATPERKGAFEPAYEPLKRGDARTYEGAAGPKSSAEVFVSRPGPAAVFDVIRQAGSPPLTDNDAERFAGEAPMEIDDPTAKLRAAAYALPGDAREILKAQPPAAPEVGATEAVQVSGRVGDDIIEGEVAVARPKKQEAKEGKAK